MATTPEQQRRAEECSWEAKKYGLKWGVISGVAAIAAHFLFENTWGWWQHSLKYQGKIAFPVVAVTGGFWVASERKVLECARYDQALLGERIKERRIREREEREKKNQTS
mmetsp:Transcript_17073/g.23748  ORF Transcript_17073/g.23748 Transcript_17073/m.23748 type:complete len:110 (-) Transcript_17073:96-425(-)